MVDPTPLVILEVKEKVCVCVRVYVFVSVSFSFGTSLQISQMGEFWPDDNQLIGFLCIFIKPIQSFILALAER